MVGAVSKRKECQWKYGGRRKARLTSRVDGRGDCDIVTLCLSLVLRFCDCDTLQMPCVSSSLLRIQTIRAQEGGKKASAIHARNLQESVQETVFRGKEQSRNPPSRIGGKTRGSQDPCNDIIDLSVCIRHDSERL